MRARRQPVDAPRRPPVLREHPEQVRVAYVLTVQGILFTAQNHGAALSGAQAGKARAAGVRAGAPDLLIFDPPPALPELVGTALELKAKDLLPRARLTDPWAGASDEQRSWLLKLRVRQWHVLVAYGADDAIEKLRAAGYPLGRTVTQ